MNRTSYLESEIERFTREKEENDHKMKLLKQQDKYIIRALKNAQNALKELLGSEDLEGKKQDADSQSNTQKGQ